MTENIKDLLPFYALDALTDDERALVDAWLSSHPDAQAELDEMTRTTEQMADTIEPIVPSTSVKSALMDRVASDPRAVTSAPAPMPHSQATPRQTFWEKWGARWLSPAVAAVSLALAAFMFVNILNLRQQTSRQQSLITRAETQVAELSNANQALETALDNTQQQVESTATELAEEKRLRELSERNASDLSDQIDQLRTDLQGVQRINQELEQKIAEDEELIAIFTAPNWQTALIVGTEFAQNASGHLVVNPDKQQAVLSVSNLETLPEHQTYQFWLIGDDGPESAGTFIINPDGSATHTFPLHSFEPYAAIGVSIEPVGGSDQPTGNIVMLTPDA